MQELEVLVAGLLALGALLALTSKLLKRDAGAAAAAAHERRVLAATEDGAAAAALAPEDEQGDIAEARLLAGGNRLARRRALRAREKEDRKTDGEARVEVQNRRLQEEEEKREAHAREADMKAQIREERAAILQEREKAKAQAELDQWAGMMSITADGEDDAPEDVEARYHEALLAAIHREKVVSMEALSAELDRPVEELAATMDSLLASGRLTGIHDDRGRFVHITPAEYTAVERYVRQRGRVAVADLAAESSRLVEMQP
eukprot:TRINITY_DN12947_c0_g1_i1.p2 TRINITY_DN12947_c0_g1~~TRINITY_DN12947_c0_g1_i1.p2  ORF type:complete len:261 (+),score=94.05 TRINITY_DN12947_c0_g1_i1:78-860(+)